MKNIFAIGAAALATACTSVPEEGQYASHSRMTKPVFINGMARHTIRDASGNEICSITYRQDSTGQDIQNDPCFRAIASGMSPSL